MKKNDCFNLGYIVKRVGNHGDLSVFLDVDSPIRYKELSSFFVELNNSLVPFFIKKIQISGTNATVSIEGIDTIEKAEELIKASVYLPLSLLPSLSGKRFYLHEMPGFTVVDKNHGNIGVIEEVLNYSPQVIFQIKHGKYEILIPAEEKFIVNINRKERIIEVDAPEGLIDIYTNNADEEE